MIWYIDTADQISIFKKNSSYYLFFVVGLGQGGGGEAAMGFLGGEGQA